MRIISLFILLLSAGCSVSSNNELQTRANQGDARAQYQLAVSRADVGDLAGLTAAVEWYLKAAKQGYAPAQYNLGHHYLRGTGVSKDAAEAFRWFGKAASQEVPEAQFNLALMHMEGLGAEKNPIKAVIWALKAAESGYLEAQYNLAVWYGIGASAAVDDAQAFKWYLNAAKQGHAESQLIVGGRYHSGVGVTEDRVIGQAWLLISEAKRAADYRDHFAKQMAVSDLQKSQRVADKCRDSGYQDCG